MANMRPPLLKSLFECSLDSECRYTQSDSSVCIKRKQPAGVGDEEHPLAVVVHMYYSAAMPVHLLSNCDRSNDLF